MHLDRQTVHRHAYPRTAKNIDTLTKCDLHYHFDSPVSLCKAIAVLGGITPCGFIYDPGVVPIFFAIDAMLALVGLIMGSREPWAD